MCSTRRCSSRTASKWGAACTTCRLAEWCTATLLHATYVSAGHNDPIPVLLPTCETVISARHVLTRNCSDHTWAILLTQRLARATETSFWHRALLGCQVLLDAASTCKVSDFGMTSAVGGDDGDCECCSQNTHCICVGGSGSFPFVSLVRKILWLACVDES